MDKFARGGAVFENTFSPHIPTTPAYSCMFTGLDCFGTDMVALRHAGADPRADAGADARRRGLRHHVRRLQHARRSRRASRPAMDYQSWGSWAERPLPKAERLARARRARAAPPGGRGRPFFLLLRNMDPHSPYLPPPPFDRMFYGGNECDPANKSMEPVLDVQAVPRLLRLLDAAGHHGQGLRHRAVRRRGGLHGRLHRQHLRAWPARWASRTTRSSS